MKKQGIGKLLMLLIVAIILVVVLIFLVLLRTPSEEIMNDTKIMTESETLDPTKDPEEISNIYDIVIPLEVESWEENPEDISVTLTSGNGPGVITDINFLLWVETGSCFVEQTIELRESETITLNIPKKECSNIIDLEVEVIGGRER